MGHLCPFCGKVKAEFPIACAGSQWCTWGSHRVCQANLLSVTPPLRALVSPLTMKVLDKGPPRASAAKCSLAFTLGAEWEEDAGDEKAGLGWGAMGSGF